MARWGARTVMIERSGIGMLPPVLRPGADRRRCADSLLGAVRNARRDDLADKPDSARMPEGMARTSPDQLRQPRNAWSFEVERDHGWGCSEGRLASIPQI